MSTAEHTRKALNTEQPISDRELHSVDYFAMTGASTAHPGGPEQRPTEGATAGEVATPKALTRQLGSQVDGAAKERTNDYARWVEDDHVGCERNETLASAGGFERIARALHQQFPSTRFRVREDRWEVWIHYISNLPNSPSVEAVWNVLKKAAPATTWKIPRRVSFPPELVQRQEIRGQVMEVLNDALFKTRIPMAYTERLQRQVREALNEFVANVQPNKGHERPAVADAPSSFVTKGGALERHGPEQPARPPFQRGLER
jgi:hypothetical protein